MDTKSKIAEQVIRILSGGDNDGRWDRREIILAIDQSRDFFAKADYWEKMNAGEREVAPDWITTLENVPAILDSGKDLWYSVLTSIPISLPKNAGLIHVGFMQSLYDPMIPIKVTDAWALKESGTNIVDMLGSTGYFQEGNRIYYVGYNGSANILIKMVANSSSIGESEFFPCPPDYIQRIVDKVVSQYAPAQNKPVDVSNNKVPNG